MLTRPFPRVVALALGAVLLSLGCGVGGDTGPADGTPPQLRIDAPTQGAQVTGQVSIDVTAVDDISGVDRVRFFVDDVILTDVFTTPYHAVWNAVAAVDGSNHVIKVEARDVAGNTATATVGVTVVRAHQ